MKPGVSLRAIKTGGSVLCLLAAAIALIYQFKISNLWPLLFVGLFVTPIRWLSPGWFRAAWIIPLGGFSLLLLDAYAGRHWVAVEARAWSPIWDTPRIARILVSPSGKTTVYVLQHSWLDTSCSVWVSDGGLFPRSGYIEYTGKNDEEQELVAGWHGSLFLVGHRLISYAYDEADRKAHYSREVIYSQNVPANAKILESFSAHIATLKKKN